jgi:hypothetical protein
MLDAPRYLLGVIELGLLAGFSTVGAAQLRRRLLPGFAGPAAWVATAVPALALLILTAEALGSFGAFEPLPYLAAVAVVGAGTWAAARGPLRPVEGVDGRARGAGLDAATLIGLAIATVAIVHFAADVRPRLSTGMTGFDSTWYHGPFAAGFFQSGNTWDLHFIAPQFLAWFYPSNAELFHAVGMAAFGRDILSPLLNLGWLIGCLAAAWCIGRPYGVGPWSLALGAIALSVPALADQAGEARNDAPAIFFLLSGVAIAVNARFTEQSARPGSAVGALALVGLAAGLAAGTKLNFLLPAAVLVLGAALIQPRGRRLPRLVVAAAASLLGGGYWYLRNLAHAGNPLPWFDHLGPLALPAPEQELGGREGHTVLGYLTDGSVWSEWFLPGLHHGLWAIWPLLVVLAAAGLLLSLRRTGDGALPVAGAVGVALVVAWLVAPTSASGPDGMPRGFESGLRYLAPALVLGLSLLPATVTLRDRLSRIAPAGSIAWRVSRRMSVAVLVGLLLVAVAAGYPIERHYLENRYADPSFSTPGLNAAFRWARSLSGDRIATTSTRQYPLFGTDLSNRVQYVGARRPHGGFVPPSSCPQWRRLLNAGRYDYVVASRDRAATGGQPYPATARWTEGPGATVILRKPPTVVFRLTGPLDPSACPG